jgi:hypothetical protein
MRLDRPGSFAPALLVAGAQLLSACHSTPTNANMIAPSPIAVKLDVRVDGRHVPAELEFRNTTDEKVFLYEPNACDKGKIRKNVFNVAGGKGPIEYKGPYMKLAAPTAADFIEIAPGATFSVTVQLDEAYDFPPGAGSYEVRYSAINPSPEPGVLSDLQSELVAFELK